MSLIGTLEQVNVSLIFERIETYAKTGLLVVRQDVQWAELYFREGKLMCIGPVRANATLGDRLLQAGIISPEALRETLLALGGRQPDETHTALALMEAGYVTREDLRTWAIKEATQVLRVLATWQNGDIYFEEGVPTPPDRLLAALTASSLAPPMSVPHTQPPSGATSAPQVLRETQQVYNDAVPLAPMVAEEPIRSTISASSLVNVPASLDESQFIAETPRPTISFAPSAEVAFSLNLTSDAVPSNHSPLPMPQVVEVPFQPRRIDTSFLRPEMVLIPIDFSGGRENNSQVQITPDQWRLLTRVDGQTSLQAACRELTMPVEQVRQVAGELITLGMVQASAPMQLPQTPIYEISSVSREILMAGVGNGYLIPGYAAAPIQTWGSVSPTTDPLSLSPSGGLNGAFAGQPQWGNGQNGTAFVQGRGWVTTSQPLQPVQTSGALYPTNGVYAQAGGGL